MGRWRLVEKIRVETSSYHVAFVSTAAALVRRREREHERIVKFAGWAGGDPLQAERRNGSEADG